VAADAEPAAGHRSRRTCHRRGVGVRSYSPLVSDARAEFVAEPWGEDRQLVEVLGERGPIPGLYAAGETTGHFFGTAPNAVAMLRALVFGRIAGAGAVTYCLERRSRGC